MDAAFKRDPDWEERMTMPPSDNGDLREQVAGLRSDVRHIQSDVTDIKADLRATATDIKTDLRATNQKIDQIRDSLASVRVWVLGLHVALGGSLLYVIARGLKWL
jgi:hypothetical protein